MSTNVMEPREMKTRELVSAVLANDKESDKAFRILYQRYKQFVLLWIQPYCDTSSDTESLIQDIFLQAYRKLSELRDGDAFPHWLKTTAKRMAINYGKRKKDNIPFSVLEGNGDGSYDTGGREEDPVQHSLRMERSKNTLSALDKLRHKHSLDYQALMLFYFDGKSLLEIVDELNAPLGTIKRRLHEGRIRFKKFYEELMGVDTTP